MSLPQRPDAASSPRRRRPSDLENKRSHDRTASKNGAYTSYTRPLPSPGTPVPMERDPIMAGHHTSQSPELGRKRSLIRPERRRVDPNDPNYHYRKHAQKMTVYPSTTGNDPILEDHLEAQTVSSDSTDVKPQHLRNASSTYNDKQTSLDDQMGPPQRQLTRSKTMEKLEKQRQKERDAVRPPSLWNVYCAIITFWCPNAILKCFGKVQKAQQRAWREKMGLVSIILMICTVVGYLTFGFTQTVCPNGGSARLQINKVDKGFMIIHGKAYDLTKSTHPLARNVPANANVLYDLPEKHGGQDASFLFQNVNGACKNLITPAPNSDLPKSSNGDLAWYFPCQVFNQDGSSRPNETVPPYFGYQCHTGPNARGAFYGLHSAGDVYFTWNDVRNSSRNLMVWGNDVLDLNLLNWFNTSQVAVPDSINRIKQNANLKGLDITRAFSSSYEKQIAKCLSQTIKVGSIDTESIGCIASKVVLYVSLIFILAIVGAKFVLALAFQWFISKQFGASKTSLGMTDSKERKQQIEEWSDDIYRPPPRLMDPAPGPDRSSRRGSQFLPSTSRFTSPYAMEKSAKSRGPPTTMTSQSASSRLGSNNGMYSRLNTSHGTLSNFDGKPLASQSSLLLSGTNDQGRHSTVMGEEGPGPAGFIHEAVVPQPPPEWEPFGYPLAHSICLVTAYSEGADGIRTTLDSIATTDYPNSHKLLLVICDGMIKGAGENLTTPEICLGMMKDHAVLPHEVQSFSYVAVASGSKRHNMAKVYAGFYDYGENSRIPVEKQQRIPMLTVVKCGTPDEAKKSKPGNRGKRDSQIILMSFLQKVMFDERMTELEFEMFNGIWKITGISPDYYEIVLMVDADTKVFPDSLTHMISAMVKDPEIMGLCGETKIANKRDSWVSMIQVFE
jgi:chitin synthase